MKSNIGHLELTAGVAGVIKVLLQLQHKKLVKSLHCEQINPYIQLEGSPFYIVQETRDWEALRDRAGNPFPRRAGVSSFGFGGANAHVVLEEYVPKLQAQQLGGFAQQPSLGPVRRFPILLSARNEERLHEQVRQLLAWLAVETCRGCGSSLSEGSCLTCTEEPLGQEQRLQDLAYTLQVGREAMEERLALQVSSFAELEEKLRRYLQEPQGGGDWYRGRVRRHQEMVALLSADEELQQAMQEAIGKWLQRGKYEKLLEWWVKGVRIDWQLLYTVGAGSARSHRISLPTYPFARERYWIPGLSTQQLPRSFDQTQTVLLTPAWKEGAIMRERPIPLLTEPLVLLCELSGTLALRIQDQMASGWRCLSLSSSHLRREQRFQEMVVQLIQELQHLLRRRPAGAMLVQVVVVHGSEPSLLSALTSVLKTAQQEYPKLLGQLIEVEGEPEADELLAWLRENQQEPLMPHIRYRDGKRWLREWQELSLVSAPPSIPWKEGGCYLISGGAGGLARLFVQEIARQVEAATVILVGRSALSEEQRAQLAPGAENSGIHIDYQQVDVSDGAAVHALMQRVLAKSGHLDGIIHAAGVLRDSSLLLNKAQEEVRAVLAPKVIGVELLDEASSQIPLDFFILCSSLSAVAGGMGYADYAAANAYLDAFAHARAAEVTAGKRQGQTLSINWPLWEAGGMQMEPSRIQMMWELLGEEPMGTETGIMTLYQALACGQAQVVVLHGQVKRIKQRLLHQSRELSIGAGLAPDRVRLYPGTVPTAMPVESATEEEDGGKNLPLRERASAYFRKQLASALNLPVQQIEADAPLEDYGFNSIMVIRFTNVLEESFGPLSKALLYEYPTLHSLTEYFLHSYPEQLRSLLGNFKDGNEEAPATAPVRIPTDTPVCNERIRQDKEARVGDIAIIGLAGRYPGARDLHAFWENLSQGRDCITEIPLERWDHRLYFDADKDKSETTYSKWGGFLEGVDEFDPLFFNISPSEAQMMDPQERLFLECAFATIEDAGYTRSWGEPKSYGEPGSYSMYQGNGSSRNVGVFVGVTYAEYQLFGAQAQSQGRLVALAGSPASIANRVSYVCNFHGPSMTVDTMCSSSLTAIHLACQSLQQGECELAVAGGVNVSIHPNKYLLLGQSGFVSSQGNCQSFGLGADGYVPSEGVGAVLLKPLTQAEADHDHIYGVIKATAINHGGKTNGYTVPNPRAQADVIGRALNDAGIDPRTISYIEAHGTGTVLGDPIEIAGLTRAFEACGVTDKQYCAIGSVKSNIGHTESAAGIAGVTKVLLQMRYGQLAPSLHAQTLNPHIDFSATPFVVQQELSEWKRPELELEGQRREYPRVAGISSFGARGANAHVLIEEYKPGEARGEKREKTREDVAVIVLSARNEERLREQAQQLLIAVSSSGSRKDIDSRRLPAGKGYTPNPNESSGNALGEHDLFDVAYTLQVGREAMEERLAVLVRSFSELKDKLQAFVDGRHDSEDLYRGQLKRDKGTMAVFVADEDLQHAIDIWIAKKKYARLVDLWVKGLMFDWHKLYGEEKPHRVSLPTYPFARERYWWSPMLKSNSAASADITAVNNGEVIREALADVPDHVESNEQRQEEIPDQTARIEQKDADSVPRHELERKVVAIWEEVLGVRQVAIDSDFQDLGGDSIMATRIISRLKKSFPFDLNLDNLFGALTVADMVQIVEEALIEKIEELPKDAIQQLLSDFR